MASTTKELAHDFSPFLLVYKDGSVDKFNGYEWDYVPPSNDTNDDGNVVKSKDVIVSHETNATVRLFLPKTINPDQKLPLVVYVHGGAFIIESAFSSQYHNYVTSLVAEGNVMVVSVEYRLAPENLIPACYDDSWAVIQWVDSHNGGQGQDPWLNDHADLGRVFLAGDSAGANIAHYMVSRASEDGLSFNTKLIGLILVNPYFGREEDIDFWKYICPDTTGFDDTRLNPATNPGLLAKLVCERVIVFTGENDFVRENGWRYYDALRKSEWVGMLEIMETAGVEHVFHLKDPNSEKAKALMKHVISFLE